MVQDKEDRSGAGPAPGPAPQGPAPAESTPHRHSWLGTLDWQELIELMHTLHDALAGSERATKAIRSMVRFVDLSGSPLAVPIDSERMRIEALRVAVQSELRERARRSEAG